MSPKLDEDRIAQMLANSSKVFEINKVKEVKGRSPVTLYEICLGPHRFAHLYLDQKAYSIVWIESEPFDPAQPFMFVDLQFSNIPIIRLRMVRNVLPKRKRDLLHYYQDSCRVSVIINDEDVQEFDLIDQKDRDAYMTNFVNQDRLASAAFVRYDSTVVAKVGEKKKEYFCGFTAENLQDGARSGLECTLRIPRTLHLKERVLTWMARDLIVKNKIDSVDFSGSLARLHKLVGVSASR